MTEGKIGFFAALWRFISLYEARKALGLVRAADKMFTGSAEGISDGFAMYREQLVKNFNDLTQAVTQSETAHEMMVTNLQNLLKEIEDKKELQAGADQLYDEAEAAKDEAEMKTAREDSERFTAALAKLQQEATDLEAQIKQDEIEVKDLETQLSKMLSEIENLKGEEAKEIAKFITNKSLIDARERVAGLKSRLDSSPIDAIKASNNELAAKAKVLGRVTRATTNDQDDKYRKAARNTEASDAFEKRKAAREAEKAQKEAAKNDATTEKESRPKNF